MVETFEHLLAEPETLTERRLLRIANVQRLGWAEIMDTALSQSRSRSPQAQWALRQPILEEAEVLVIQGRPTAPNRPKRLTRTRCGLVIRRERTREGWLLHLTGPRASDRIVGEIIDRLELEFTPA